MNRLTLTLIFIFAAIAVGGLAIFLFMPSKVENETCSFKYEIVNNAKTQVDFEEKVKAGNCDVIQFFSYDDFSRSYRDIMVANWCNFDKAIIKVSETKIMCVPLNK